MTFLEILLLMLLLLALLTATWAFRRVAFMQKSDREFGKWAWSLNKELTDAGRISYSQLIVLWQVGELFDHVGVDLEGGSHIQEAKDLKQIGAILRGMQEWQEHIKPAADNSLESIADRYGFEPNGSEGYPVRTIIRMAEEIIERVMNKGAARITAA